MHQMSSRCFTTSGKCVSSQVIIPTNFVQRAKGLLGRDRLKENESLLIYNCSSIHMFGMKFAIDLIFLDASLRIVKVVKSLKPWRLASCKQAKHTMELAEDSIAIHGLVIGERLMINEYEK